MAVHNGVFPHSYQVEEKEVKEPKKVPWNLLRFSFVIAALAWLALCVMFPNNLAIVSVGGIVGLFGVSLLYAKTLQRQAGGS